MTVENIDPMLDEEEISIKFVVVYSAVILISCLALVGLVMLFKK